MAESGTKITFNNNEIQVPNDPVIPFIEGDGIGPDIWRAAKRVLDASVDKTFGGKKKIVWKEILAGEKAKENTGEWLPEATVEAIKEFHVAIKGPLTTPVGGGIRSLNVTLRQVLDLFACVRPIRYFRGVPSPVKTPEKVDMVVFRENTEDVYAGLEWKSGSPEARKLIDFLNGELGCRVLASSGMGIKPMSPENSGRLTRLAIQYAIKRKKPSVTLVHKGNIMKFTEGAFKEWGYQLAAKEFPETTLSEAEIWDKHHGKTPAGKVLIKDRIADAMFQQALLRPAEYSVLAVPNLNGDYLSDALIAQVGGLGIGPGANIGHNLALFEATHGTAPKYAGLDKVNPGSVILSGVMMLEHLEWQQAADRIVNAIQKTIDQKTVTYDFARQMENATEVKCSEFADHIIENL